MPCPDEYYVMYTTSECTIQPGLKAQTAVCSWYWQQMSWVFSDAEEFNTRMLNLVGWLKSQRESSIALVAHWGVLNWLTHRSFENAEFGVITI